MSDEIIKEGVAGRLKSKAWKKRILRLTPSDLSFFKSKKPQGPAEGTIPVSSIVSVQNALVETGKDLAFIIKTSDADYVFVVATREVYDEWMSVLPRAPVPASKRFSLPAPPPASAKPKRPPPPPAETKPKRQSTALRQLLTSSAEDTSDELLQSQPRTQPSPRIDEVPEVAVPPPVPTHKPSMKPELQQETSQQEISPRPSTPSVSESQPQPVLLPSAGSRHSLKPVSMRSQSPASSPAISPVAPVAKESPTPVKPKRAEMDYSALSTKQKFLEQLAYYIDTADEINYAGLVEHFQQRKNKEATDFFNTAAESVKTAITSKSIQTVAAYIIFDFLQWLSQEEAKNASTTTPSTSSTPLKPAVESAPPAVPQQTEEEKTEIVPKRVQSQRFGFKLPTPTDSKPFETKLKSPKREEPKPEEEAPKEPVNPFKAVLKPASVATPEEVVPPLPKLKPTKQVKITEVKEEEPAVETRVVQPVETPAVEVTPVEEPVPVIAPTLDELVPSAEFSGELAAPVINVAEITRERKQLDVIKRASKRIPSRTFTASKKTEEASSPAPTPVQSLPVTTLLSPEPETKTPTFPLKQAPKRPLSTRAPPTKKNALDALKQVETKAKEESLSEIKHIPTTEIKETPAESEKPVTEKAEPKPFGIAGAKPMFGLPPGGFQLKPTKPAVVREQATQPPTTAETLPEKPTPPSRPEKPERPPVASPPAAALAAMAAAVTTSSPQETPEKPQESSPAPTKVEDQQEQTPEPKKLHTRFGSNAGMLPVIAGGRDLLQRPKSTAFEIRKKEQGETSPATPSVNPFKLQKPVVPEKPSSPVVAIPAPPEELPPPPPVSEKPAPPTRPEKPEKPAPATPPPAALAAMAVATAQQEVPEKPQEETPALPAKKFAPPAGFAPLVPTGDFRATLKKTTPPAAVAPKEPGSPAPQAEKKEAPAPQADFRSQLKPKTPATPPPQPAKEEEKPKEGAAGADFRSLLKKRPQ